MAKRALEAARQKALEATRLQEQAKRLEVERHAAAAAKAALIAKQAMLVKESMLAKEATVAKAAMLTKEASIVGQKRLASKRVTDWGSINDLLAQRASKLGINYKR